MRKISILTLILCAFAVSAIASPRYDIVPMPRKLVAADGDFVIQKNTALVVENTIFEEIASDFRDRISLVSGFALNGSGNRIVLRKVEGLGKEAYNLSVTPASAVIEASEVNGAFYGLQTLLQLLPAEVMVLIGPRASCGAYPAAPLKMNRRTGTGVFSSTAAVSSSKKRKS